MVHALQIDTLACGDNMEALSGTVTVEVDETYIGRSKEKHQHKRLKAGCGAVGKQAAIGAEKQNGNVQTQVIDKTGGATLKGFVKSTVKAGSTIYTDEHKGYNELGASYQHGTVKHNAKEYVNDMAHTNDIENVQDRLDSLFCKMFGKVITYKELVA